jgi:hypothetical protein
MSETIEPRVYLEVNAGNDVNGNPRRAAVVFGLTEHGAHLVDVIDEGYEGYPEWVRRLRYLGQFHVPVKRYRAYLKQAAVKP